MNVPAIHRPWLQLPKLRGEIERRILVNFCCEPQVLAQMLPSPFRPKLVNGFGIAGICLIRLAKIYPTIFPSFNGFGFASENVAHRIAVEWDENDGVREGVFIPRRDTNAMLNRLVGGKIFPGVHHAATFQIHETSDRFEVKMRSDDGAAFIHVLATTSNSLQPDSVFHSLKEASDFFQRGAVGWSACHTSGKLERMELHCDEWQMEALAVEKVESSFFQNEKFPRGSIKFDSAFLMRNVPHEWHA